jgi:hypothetical protein
MAGNPEEAKAYSIKESVYAHDASGEGDYVEEPIEQPFYAFDVSGAGDAVQEEFILCSITSFIGFCIFKRRLKIYSKLTLLYQLHSSPILTLTIGHFDQNN